MLLINNELVPRVATPGDAGLVKTAHLIRFGAVLEHGSGLSVLVV